MEGKEVKEEDYENDDDPTRYLKIFFHLATDHTFPLSLYPEKTADISRRHWWSPREMTSEKRAQKFHTDDVSLPRSG